MEQNKPGDPPKDQPEEKAFECEVRSVRVTGKVVRTLRYVSDALYLPYHRYHVDVSIGNRTYVFTIHSYFRTNQHHAHTFLSTSQRPPKSLDSLVQHSQISTDDLPQLFERALEQVLHYHLSQVQQQQS